MPRTRKPDWLKVPSAGGGERYSLVRGRLAHHALHTVCDEARCPNRAECWNAGTATLLLLGDVCTRGCRFCAVGTGWPGGALDEDEPTRAAATADELGLDYVVLTSVDRDDLADGGASVYAAAARAILVRRPSTVVEALIPDFGGNREALTTLVEAPISVVGHNIEVVRRLTESVRDRRASYDRSLDVLRAVKELDPERFTKSSLLLGLGEQRDEISEALRDLAEAGVDIVTLGQYLQPTRKQVPVSRYVTPAEFDELADEARALGFGAVASGPLVRSSYRAREIHDELSAPRT